MLLTALSRALHRERSACNDMRGGGESLESNSLFFGQYLEELLGNQNE